MKTYKINDLKKIANEQGYKMAALENSEGQRILPFNQIKVPVAKHLDLIPTRLKSELNPDGIYYVLMAHNIQASKQPHRYPITKGKVSAEELSLEEKNKMPLTPVQVISPVHEVLTYDKALEYQQKISDLQTRVNQLEFESNELHKQVEELEAELEENEGLQEEQSQPNNIVTFLKEAIPSITPLLDRHFDLQERKLNLEELKVNGSGKSSSGGVKKGTERREVIPGSQEHLNVIEYYFEKEMDSEMNRELDKLERANPEMYLQVVQKLGLEEEEGGEDA